MSGPISGSNINKTFLSSSESRQSEESYFSHSMPSIEDVRSEQTTKPEKSWREKFAKSLPSFKSKAGIVLLCLTWPAALIFGLSGAAVGALVGTAFALKEKFNEVQAHGRDSQAPFFGESQLAMILGGAAAGGYIGGLMGSLGGTYLIMACHGNIDNSDQMFAS